MCEGVHHQKFGLFAGDTERLGRHCDGSQRHFKAFVESFITLAAKSLGLHTATK